MQGDTPQKKGLTEQQADQVSVRPPRKLQSKLDADHVKDFVLVQPFLLPLAYPQLEFDPIARCWAETQKPTDWVALDTDAEFQVGQRGRDLGIPGNMLMGIYHQEWETIKNFVASCVIMDDVNKIRIALAWQTIEYVLPDRTRLPVAAIAVCDSQGSYLWESDSPFGSNRYRPRRTEAVHAATVDDLFSLVEKGSSDPLTDFERKHGFRRFI